AIQVALSRRAFLHRGGFGLGSIALAMLLRDRAWGVAATAQDPLAPKRPHFAPRAKNVIYLHMIGAPSQLDLFDHKPALVKHDGQTCPEELTRGRRFAFIGGALTLAGSRFRFARHGQSGQVMSELLPHLAEVAD